MNRSRHLSVVRGGEVVSLRLWRSGRRDSADAADGAESAPPARSRTGYLRRRAMEEAAVAQVDRVLDRAGRQGGGRLPLRAAVDAVRRHRDPW